MAKVLLQIEADVHRLTLKVMLEQHGHEAAPTREEAQAAIVDAPEAARELVHVLPTLMLAAASQVPEAVRLMEDGLYGYIFLPLQPKEAALMLARALDTGASAPAADEPEALTLDDVERAHIMKVLRACRYNQTEAARKLGIGRNTLWRKLRRYRSRRD